MDLPIGKEWEELRDIISGIGDYYGVVLSQRHILELSRQALQYIELDMKAKGIMQQKFYAKCVDGTIKHGYLKNTSLHSLMALRNKISNKTLTHEDYGKLLLKSDEQFTYCSDNEMLYSGIEPLVGRYVMRHNLSKRILDIITGYTYLPEITTGNSIQIFNKYLKIERNIYDKKTMFNDDFLKALDYSSLNSPLFPLYYLMSMDIKEMSKEPNFVSCYRHNNIKSLIALNCESLEIPYYNTLRRFSKGEIDTVDKAIQLAKDEAQKYKFVFEANGSCVDYIVNGQKMHMRATNYNFIKYIEYLSKQEEEINNGGL